MSVPTQRKSHPNDTVAGMTLARKATFVRKASLAWETTPAWVLAVVLMTLLALPGRGMAAGLDPSGAAYESHKIALLKLEARVRQRPENALSGVPGAALRVLACDGEGCLGPHRLTLNGRDLGTAMSARLARAFSVGGWVPLVLPRGVESARLTWQAGDKAQQANLPVPVSGTIIEVRHQGAALAVTVQVPSVSHARRLSAAARGAGDYLEAVALLEAGATLGDLTATDQLQIADLLFKAGLPQAARARYQALMQHADAVVVWRATLGMARIAFARGGHNRVVTLLTPLKVPAEHPLAAQVADLLIRAYLAQGQDEMAALVRVPKAVAPFMWANRAMAYYGQGDTFSAVTDLKRAIRQSNRSVPEEAYLRERLLLTVGTIQAEQGKLTEALVSFDQMSPEGPFGDRYRFARGLAFYNNHDRVKAVAELQQLVQNSPDSPYALEGLLVMGEAYRALNAPRQAVDEFRKALARFQGRSRAIDFLLTDTAKAGFGEGLTELIFKEDWRGDGWRSDRSVPPRLSSGLRILFATESLAHLLNEHRQITLAVTRLEGLKRGLSADDADLKRRVNDGLEGLYVFRTLFQGAAREQILATLRQAGQEAEELAVAASMGLSQSVLFDATGGSGGSLLFGLGR